MSEETVLAAHNISLTRGEQTIMSGLSVSVPANARMLIRGASGAGKSTLFAVLGLLTSPDSGSVSVMGDDASSLSERERAALRRDHLGFVFQDFRLIDDLTAYENARVPQEHANDIDEAWLDTLFDRLSITALADRAPPTLSGGERQRVAIVRALANRPDVILADEPTGQLDPTTTDAVLETLLSVHDTFDTALVVVSHDSRLGDAFSDEFLLADGALTRQ
jgi:putative ABC transport system ATP-binding protein